MEGVEGRRSSPRHEDEAPVRRADAEHGTLCLPGRSALSVAASGACCRYLDAGVPRPAPLTALLHVQDPALRRHLLRLWLSPPNAPPLPDIYSDILGGSVAVGDRGGIVLRDTKLHVPLEAA